MGPGCDLGKQPVRAALVVGLHEQVWGWVHMTYGVKHLADLRAGQVRSVGLPDAGSSGRGGSGRDSPPHHVSCVS